MWIQPEPQTIHDSIQLLRANCFRAWIGLEDFENVRTACGGFMLRDYPEQCACFKAGTLL